MAIYIVQCLNFIISIAVSDLWQNTYQDKTSYFELFSRCGMAQLQKWLPAVNQINIDKEYELLPFRV